MRVTEHRGRAAVAAGFIVLLMVLTAQNISARSRPLAFFRPVALKKEAKILLHFFVFSKWINRYFTTHNAPPPDVFTAAREQGEEGRVPDNAADPWGTAYRVEMYPDSFTVCSAGPDGTFATADDRYFHSYSHMAPARPVAGAARVGP